MHTITAGSHRMVPFADLAPTTGEVREEIQEGWQALLDSNEWIGGAAVRGFEESWARYCGTSEAIGVANGTDALHLILRALGIGPGDEVLVPANTFIATVEAVVLAGARPRYVDVDPHSLLLTAEAVDAAVTPATAAVIPVHLYGHVADLAGLARVTRRHGLALVEDAAQAHGAMRDQRRAGSVGVAAGFSFYPGKNLGAFGDAGAVVTSDAALAARIRSLANHGRSETDRYHHPLLGTNSRLDALQAVVLAAKLPRLDAWTDLRRTIVAVYRERLENLPLRLVEPEAGVASAWHLLVARVPDRDRDRVRAALAERGIQTGSHYPIPCPQQLAYSTWADREYPVTDQAARETVSLPLHPHMGVEEVDAVSRALAAVLTRESTVGVAGPATRAMSPPSTATSPGRPPGPLEPRTRLPVIDPEPLPAPLSPAEGTPPPARRGRRIRSALGRTGGRVTGAARGARDYARRLPNRARLGLLCAALLLLPALGAALVSGLQTPTWAAEVDLLHEPADTGTIENVEREMATQQFLLLRRPLVHQAAAAVGRDAEELAEAVSVDLVPGSSVLRLRVTDRDAERAMNTADFLVDHYLESARRLPGAADIGVLRTLGQPSLADDPVAPQPMRAAAAGLLLGSVLVVGLLAFLRRSHGKDGNPAS